VAGIEQRAPQRLLHFRVAFQFDSTVLPEILQGSPLFAR